jgi:acyl transferase domain-containing protein
MPSRAEPTVAQKRFAEGIVMGKTKTDAYALAHPNDKSSRKTVRMSALNAAKSPAVQAEIKRLWSEPIVLEQFPDASNPHALRAHAVATMARLSKSADQVIAMRAADWLKNYADSLESMSTAPNESKTSWFVPESAKSSATDRNCGETR